MIHVLTTPHATIVAPIVTAEVLQITIRFD